MNRLRRTLLLVATAALPWAFAQTVALESLAPAETLLALGLQGGTLADADLQEAWDALDIDTVAEVLTDLGAALAVAGGSVADDVPLDILPLGDLGELGADAVDDVMRELDAVCPGLGDVATNLVERDWIDDLLLSVSADRFSPLPGVLALARVSEEGQTAAETLNAQLVNCFGGEVIGEEAGAELVVLFDGTDLPLVAAQQGSLFILGSRPDLVRGALRRAAGSDEDSLANHPASALVGEGPGARLYWNASGLAGVVSALLPFPPEDPMRPVIDRGVAVVDTLGVGGARISLTAEGAVLESVFQPNPDGGDATFYELISCAGCSVGAPDMIPAGAVEISAATLRAGAWIDWLDELAGDVSEALGSRITVREFLGQMLGLDLDTLLLDWLGNQVITARLAPVDTDLGSLIYGAPTIMMIPVTNEAQARAGIESLQQQVPALLNAFDLDEMLEDVAGGSGTAVTRDVTIAGVDAIRLQVGPTLDLAIAVHANHVWLATPASALETVLSAESVATSSATWRNVEAIPGQRIGWSMSDPAADLAGLADLLDVAAQPVASLLELGITAALEEAQYDSWDMGGMDYGYEPWLNDLTADPFTYAGPDGLLEAPRSTLPVGMPQSGMLGNSFLGGETMDVWELPPLAYGTEASVVLQSDAFDTYLYLYDAETGEEVAYNDDEPDTSRSEIRFLTDGRALLVGVNDFMGSETGMYTLELQLAGSGMGDAMAEEPDVDEREPVEAPSFADLLDVTEFAADAVRLLADRAGPAWGAVTVEDGLLRQQRFLTFDW